MKIKKDALKEQEAEMLKQFNVEELEERLEMGLWKKDGCPPVNQGGSTDCNGIYK